MTMCKMSPINLFLTFYLKMHVHNHQWRIQVPWYEGAMEKCSGGYTLLEGASEGRHTNVLRKLREEAQFWVNNEATLTTNWRQYLSATAASAICCTKIVKNNEWILVAVRTTIIGLLYFHQFVQHIALAAASGNVVSNLLLIYLLILLRCSIKIESTQFLQTNLWGSPKPFACAFEESVPSWTHLQGPLHGRITEPGSTTPLAIVIMHLQIKRFKRVCWWHFAYNHFRFQRRYIDFECQIGVPVRSKRNYGQLDDSALCRTVSDNSR